MPTNEENFMRAPAPSPKRTIYTEAMEIFHRAADLIGLDKRVRLELEEPDYEHIFYVTIKLRDRLKRLAQQRAASKGAAAPFAGRDVLRSRQVQQGCDVPATVRIPTGNSYLEGA